MDFRISIEETGEVGREINIEIPRSIYDQRFNSAVQTASRQVRIKGFRPGRVPTKMVNKLYGQQIHFEVLGELVSTAYDQAIKDHKLAIVGEPDISFDQATQETVGDFSIKAKVFVEPTPEIKDYFGVKVEVEEQEVSDETVAQEIENFRKSHGSVKVVEDREKIKAGDLVSIDYKGTIDGEPIPASEGSGHTVEVGADKFLPGFDKALKGKSVGEECQIEVKFPKTYEDPELAGKKAQYEVKINSISVRDLPELDDELAKKSGIAETVEELKSKIREDLEKEAKNRNKQAKEEKVFEAIAENNQFEIPQPMIDAEIRGVLFRFGALDPRKRESYSFDVSQFRDSLGKSAITRVRNSIILDRVLKQEDLTLSDEELEVWLDSLASEHKVERSEVDRQLEYPAQKERVRSQAARQKIVDLLVEKAKIKSSTKPLELNS